MDADDPLTTWPTNWNDVGETRLFRLCVAPSHGHEPVETAILLDADSEDEAYFRAIHIAALFGLECECQVDVRESELYV